MGNSSARCASVPLAQGFMARAIDCQARAALDYGLANMMLDLLCVCHLRFQNEVMDG